MVGQGLTSFGDGPYSGGVTGHTEGSVSKFSVSLPTDLLQRLDSRRGLVPRSRWLAEAVKLALEVCERDG